MKMKARGEFGPSGLEKILIYSIAHRGKEEAYDDIYLFTAKYKNLLGKEYEFYVLKLVGAQWDERWFKSVKIKATDYNQGFYATFKEIPEPNPDWEMEEENIELKGEKK